VTGCASGAYQRGSINGFMLPKIARDRTSKDIFLTHIIGYDRRKLYLKIGSRPSDHYFRSVCLYVCLFVQSFFSRLPSDLDQTRTLVTCPGLVVSPRI